MPLQILVIGVIILCELIDKLLDFNKSKPNFSKILNLPNGKTLSLKDRFYFLVEGEVKSVYYTESGKRCILDVFCEKSFLSYGASVNSMQVYYIARKSSKVLSVSDKELIFFLQEHQLTELFFKLMNTKREVMNERLVSFISASSKQRLMLFLFRLAQGRGDILCDFQDYRLCLDNRMNFNELADVIGTTRSRAGLFFNQFLEQGIISTDNTNGLVYINVSKAKQYLKNNGVLCLN